MDIKFSSSRLNLLANILEMIFEKLWVKLMGL
jgi:hypothetical protein